MAFIADYYHHTFAIFSGTVHIALPSFEFDPLVLLTLTPYYDFMDMWSVGIALPGELFETSRTMTSTSFGFSLLKVGASAGAAGVFAFLEVLPEKWEMAGGRNVALGASAQSADVHQMINAAEAGDVERLKELIELGGDIKAQDETGMSALHGAARGGQLECLLWLIAQGVDVKATAKVSGE